MTERKDKLALAINIKTFGVNSKSLIIKKLALIIGVLFFCFAYNTSAQPTYFSTQTQKLLSRLDIEQPELKKIKQAENNPQQAATELLKYYKARTLIKHPLSTTSENEEITERELKYANDALKHIFVGQPAYPSHFCGENIDWNSRPVPDLEWVWQLNRMYFWNAMGKVYSHTGEEKYAKEWSEQIIDWTQKNPRDEEHKHAWRSIEAGIRGYSWSALFHRFIQSPNFTPEVLVAFLNSCYDHAEFLMTVYRTKSNWGLMEAEGMAFIAINFPEFVNAQKWKKEAIRRLNNEISIQVYPDGHQRELAMGYHLGCIRWFYRTYELAKLNGIENAFPESYLKMIELMCEVPMKLCLPDGTNVQFGDAWAGKPGQHNENFLDWSELFERKDFLYMATEGKKGKVPVKTAFALKESGLYSMRSAWNKNATCLVLKCGPDGGGHCQPDNGTFALYAGGRNLMPDAGSFIYHGDPEGRKWFRQTRIHQTLTLNGANTKYAPKLLKWQPGEAIDILVVENAGYENLTHRRSVFFVDKKYFVVVDEAIGTGIGEVDIHFQLAPGAGSAVLNRKNFSVNSNFKEGWNIFIETQKQTGLELTEEEGWVSFEYTKKEVRPAFRYRLKKDKENQQVRFVTLVVPYEKDIPDIKVELDASPTVGSSNLQLVIKENGKEKAIGYKL